MPTHAQRLIRAVRTRNYQRLRELLQRQGEANARSITGRTALHAAAEEGDMEAAQILVAAGADVNARMHTGETPLHLTVVYGEGRIPMDTDGDRSNPRRRRRNQPFPPEFAKRFLEVIKEKHPDILSDLELVDEITEANLRFLLLTACWRSKPGEFYRELEERGMNMECLDADLADELRGSSRYLRFAELLINHGANLHALSDSSSSPLQRAVEIGRVEMVELLLEKGANPNEQTHPNSVGSLIETLERCRTEVADVLLKHGATFDPHAPGQLHAAAASARVNVIEWLLKGTSKNGMF